MRLTQIRDVEWFRGRLRALLTSKPHLNTMHERFIADILRNHHNGIILDRWGELALPDGWLVAGCLFQTVWNLQAGRAPEADIKDYDLFYFDASDPSEAAERRAQARVDDVLADLDIAVSCNHELIQMAVRPAHRGLQYTMQGRQSDGAR
jgi:hypothetical protein